MDIRLSEKEDLQAMLSIYEYARKVMRENGNPNQWGDSYPGETLLWQDIRQRRSYVMLGDDGQVHGTFMFYVGEDATYRNIENGNWLNDRQYGVIHRIASDGHIKGVVRKAAEFAGNYCDNLRIDTHFDNRIMQHALEENGFVRCGIIHLEDGSPRIAYQREEA